MSCLYFPWCKSLNPGLVVLKLNALTRPYVGVKLEQVVSHLLTKSNWPCNCANWNASTSFIDSLFMAKMWIEFLNMWVYVTEEHWNFLTVEGWCIRVHSYQSSSVPCRTTNATPPQAPAGLYSHWPGPNCAGEWLPPLHMSSCCNMINA